MNPLPHENLLGTLGEVGAAFVGFSLIASLLRPEDSVESKRRFEAIRNVAEMSLLAVGASFLPIVVHAYGWGVGDTWRISSLLFALAWLLFMGSAIVRRRLIDAPILNQVFSSAVICATAIALGLLLYNIAFATTGAGARYATAVLILLGLTGALFVWAVFRPRSN